MKHAFAALVLALLTNACVSEPARETAHGVPRPQLSLAGGGGEGFDTTVWLADVGFHYAVSNVIVLGARVAGYDYDREVSQTEFFVGREVETTRTNTGRGLGIGPELRIYPVRAFDGPWIGGGLIFFPFTEGESELEGVDVATGIEFRGDGEPFEIDFAAYGAVGWTFRTGTPLSVGIELDVGTVESELFGALLLRLGYEL